MSSKETKPLWKASSTAADASRRLLRSSLLVEKGLRSLTVQEETETLLFTTFISIHSSSTRFFKSCLVNDFSKVELVYLVESTVLGRVDTCYCTLAHRHKDHSDLRSC